MGFNATWLPGPDAVAGMQNKGRYFDLPVLVMYLDQGSLAIMAPGGPSMWPGFVQFLRQLRDGAEEMANFFDVRAMSATEPGGDSETTKRGEDGDGEAGATRGEAPDIDAGA